MKWFLNLKIQNKLILVFGTFICILSIFAVFTATQLVNIDNAFKHTVKRQTSISSMLETFTVLCFNNISTSTLYYEEDIYEGIAGFRNINYEEMCKKFISQLEYYRESIKSDKTLYEYEKRERSEKINQIDSVFTLHFLRCLPKIIKGAEIRDREMVKSGVSILYESAEKITTILNEIHVMAISRTGLETNKISGGSKRIVYTLFIVAAILLLISIIVSLFMSRMVRIPITKIERAMEEISNGNLSVPIRSKNTDELGILSNRIGDMVDKIVDMNKTIAVMDYLDTMICISDFNYNLLFINCSMEKAYGVTRENCINRKCYKVLKNYDIPCRYCQLPKLLSTNEQFPSINYSYSWDDTLNAWVGGRAAIIRWVDGSPTLFQTMNDETRKKVQEEQLSKAMQTAEAASLSKSVFIANMSHEIRTPMNSIVGFSELALDYDLPDKIRFYLNKILENSNWLLQIINDILDISKIESGRLQLECIPFNLQDMFESCRALIMPLAKEKGLAMHFYAEPSIGKKLLGDPVRLRQVILNLLTNAVKFTNSGIVKLYASLKGLSDKNTTIHFEVKDSGIGMTLEQITKIFEPFIQADISTTRKYGGTGLGLTICKNIIEMMGGELNVESVPKVGSIFSFDVTFNTIDIDDEIHDCEIVSRNIEKPLFDSEVLLCEDNKTNQQVICEHLERVGIKIVVADNGKKGVEIVNQRMIDGKQPFDLIFMDIHMPVMDGVEAATKIVALGVETPVIALTANIMTQDIELYKQSGMLDCLGKPFTSHELWYCLLKFLTPVNKKNITVKPAKAQTPVDNEEEMMLLRYQDEFIDECRTTYSEITEALNSNDITLAHRIAHTLKGNAATFRKESLRVAAFDVENCLRNGENSVTEELLSTLETELNTLIKERDKKLKQHDNN
jgi:signal transduction histidine kinase/DNA-binding response OmpR family regulator/HAMP domain-containing protein